MKIIHQNDSSHSVDLVATTR